jgi:hypothetical protein
MRAISIALLVIYCLFQVSAAPAGQSSDVMVAVHLDDVDTLPHQSIHRDVHEQDQEKRDSEDGGSEDGESFAWSLCTSCLGGSLLELIRGSFGA